MCVIACLIPVIRNRVQWAIQPAKVVGEVYLLLKKKKLKKPHPTLSSLASLGNKIVLVVMSKRGIISSSPRFLPAAGAPVLLHWDATRWR